MNWFLVNTNVKTKYRQSILKVRDDLDLAKVQNLSEKIFNIADFELNLSNIKKLGVYFSTNNEVDLKKLIDRRLKKNLETTFPKIASNFSMNLIASRNIKKLNRNKYGIFEPSEGYKIHPIKHDMIIIPTLGVDKNGYRLGYGGGYYDRFLEPIMGNKNRPLLIGLIYDFQFINDSISETHDIKLDIVFSEKQQKIFSI